MGELGGALAFFTIVVVRMMLLSILTIGTERTSSGHSNVVITV